MGNKTLITVSIILIVGILFIVISKLLKSKKSASHVARIKNLFYDSMQERYIPRIIYILQSAEADDKGKLIDIGIKRSKLLVDWFTNKTLTENGVKDPQIYETPDLIYSMRGNKTCEETISHLVDTIDVPYSTQYGKNNLNELDDSIFSNPRNTNRVVLICWNRELIQDLLYTLTPQCFCVGDIVKSPKCLNFESPEEEKRGGGVLGVNYNRMWSLQFVKDDAKKRYKAIINIMNEGDKDPSWTMECVPKDVLPPLEVA